MKQMIKTYESDNESKTPSYILDINNNKIHYDYILISISKETRDSNFINTNLIFNTFLKIYVIPFRIMNPNIFLIGRYKYFIGAINSKNIMCCYEETNNII